MTLYEKARDIADDYSKKLLRKRWQSHLLAAKLLDLRSRNHWTQAEVASRAGISESAIRNYEQQKSTPKQGHLEALAHAFGIRPEALRLYDIDLMPLNALIQLGETYGLMPAYDERFAYLRPTNSFMTEALHKWAVQYRLLKEGDIDRNWYEEWKDEFNVEYFEGDFPLKYRLTSEGAEPIEPWMNIQFATALQRLRKKHGLTQDDLALAANTTKSTICSYEQKKRLPKDSQLADLARALDVTTSALTFFDFGSPVQAVHVLFQIANRHEMVPDEIDGQVMLRTARRGMERYIDQWELAQNGIYEGVAWDAEVADYQDWKDKYDFNYSGQSCRQSRYSFHWDEKPNGDSISLGLLESKYDPFDERYRTQGGFLRA